MLLEVYQNDNGNGDVQSYESVTYDGVEYNLHDCIIFYRDGEIETYIGKIVKIIGTADAGKQVKVVWFFRPSEIRNHLRDYKPRWNEIFLASGDGEGLSNTNFLVIMYKQSHLYFLSHWHMSSSWITVDACTNALTLSLCAHAVSGSSSREMHCCLHFEGPKKSSSIERWTEKCWLHLFLYIWCWKVKNFWEISWSNSWD